MRICKSVSGQTHMKTELNLRLATWVILFASGLLSIPVSAQEKGLASRSTGFSDADFQKHLEELKSKTRQGRFFVKIQKPFVVISDKSPEDLNRWSEGTIKWAVDKLKKDFFRRDPLRIIDIWLFTGKESYESNCQKLFNIKPTTPYGFYSSRHRSLIMNISTGGGTLVHEIVHPFIESNFPDCPSWFNEGLASLYEQCRERNGQIHGLTNWRLRGLQVHIKDNRVPSFKTLCATTRYEFYNDDPGTNYAQARYLCYYLQQQGKLRRFYHEFVKNVRQDPTGYTTLAAVLGESDMDRFQEKWEDYVMKLRF